MTTQRGCTGKAGDGGVWAARGLTTAQGPHPPTQGQYPPTQVQYSPTHPGAHPPTHPPRGRSTHLAEEAVHPRHDALKVLPRNVADSCMGGGQHMQDNRQVADSSVGGGHRAQENTKGQVALQNLLDKTAPAHPSPLAQPKGAGG